MGCHTWFNKRVNISYDEIKQKYIDSLKENLDFCDRLLHNRDSLDPDLLDAYPEWDEKYAIDEIEMSKQTIIEVENDKMSIEDIISRSPQSLICFNGIIYTWKDVEYHDVFRKYGYPEDVLFSMEETIEYIMEPKNKCLLYTDTMKRLIEFWTEYPDGCITFG